MPLAAEYTEGQIVLFPPGNRLPRRIGQTLGLQLVMRRLRSCRWHPDQRASNIHLDQFDPSRILTKSAIGIGNGP
jgi:hypothetical protein